MAAVIAFVYVLKCADHSYYVGSSKYLRDRLIAHKTGKVKYTKSRLPVRLVFAKSFSSYGEASVFERRVKSWKKRKCSERRIIYSGGS